jgi:hypothetical protein
MDKVSHFIQRKSDSLVGVMRKDDLFLPVSTKPRAKFQVRALLGHCLYRRVVIWTLVVIGLFSITLFNPRITQNSRNVLDLVQLGKGEIPISQAAKVEGEVSLVKQDGNGEDNTPKQDTSSNQTPSKNKDTSAKKNKDKGKKKHKNGPHWLDYEQ